MRREDLPAVKRIIDAVDLFPSEMLDGMYGADGREPGDAERWLVQECDGPVAVASRESPGAANRQPRRRAFLPVSAGRRGRAEGSCAPEPMTDGTWNLYLMAVHPDYQRQGVGAGLVSRVEAALAGHGQRILLVETSGVPGFATTREFCLRLGYDQEARIRGFYSAGDDKVVFRKALG